LGWLGGGVVLFTACVNLMYVGRPAVIVSAILATRHRTFILVVISLFVFFFLCTINFFFFFFFSYLVEQSVVGQPRWRLQSQCALCGVRGSKNRPAPFLGRMS